MKHKLIYSAANYLEADFIKGLLEQESIGTTLSGEHFSTLYPGFGVNILVNEDKFSEATEIISKYEQTNCDIARESVQDGKSWECDECHSMNPETFEICWQCQANRLSVA